MQTRILAIVIAAMFGHSTVTVAQDGADFYVDNITGHDSNTGSAAYPMKTIQAAVNQADAGSRVFVKRTNQPYASFVVAESGTASHPIKFIGYQSTPGDRDNGYGVPTSHTEAETYADYPISLGPLPYIEGANRESGTGIDFNNKNYVEIQNFYVSDFEYGVKVTGSNNKLKNVFAWNFGDIDAAYNGWGISITGGSNKRITNCVVYNSAADGIRVGASDGNIVEFCDVYADDNSTGTKSATDYYIVIINGDGNTIDTCHMEKGEPLDHWGHGVTIEAVPSSGQIATDNTVKDCTFVNIGEIFLLRGNVY